MKIKIELKVEQKHIDAASSGCAHCPIALAVREHFKVKSAWVGFFTGIEARKGGKTIFLAPVTREVVNFMNRFDSGERVEPIVLTLEGEVTE